MLRLSPAVNKKVRVMCSDPIHVWSIRRAQVGRIYKIEIYDSFSEIDDVGLEPRLILRGAIMRHAQIRTI